MKAFNKLLTLIILATFYSCNNSSDKGEHLTYKDSVLIFELYSDSSKMAFFNKDYLKSLYHLNMSLKYNKDNPSNYSNRMNIYYLLNDFDRAILDCDYIIKNYPKKKDIYLIYYYKGRCLYKKNFLKKALVWYNKSLELVSNTTSDSLEISNIYYDKYIVKKKLKDNGYLQDSLEASNYGFWMENMVR